MEKLLVFDDPEQLAHAAAAKFVEYAKNTEERFCVSLAGGNTPRRVYELLTTEPYRAQISWAKVHLFFGDERAVPPDHPDSNYAMVAEALISRVVIPAANVHRIPAEHGAKESARAYEEHLREFFAGQSWPRFDLVLLGMGEDGHTASLFPKSDALEEMSCWVVATRNVQTDADRITLTLPALNEARHVMFLVVGKKKAQRLKEVLRPKSGVDLLPAQAIKPTNGTLEWLVDANAASLLPQS
jgi:6-phosphogluconolactonase